MADETTINAAVAPVSAPASVTLPASEKPGTVDAAASGKQAEEVRAFTQQELDRIVAERLARQKQQYGDYAELKERAYVALQAVC